MNTPNVMTNAGSPVLKVSGLKKAYGAIQAVGGVSFEVMPGEIFGVIGPNGSGKTTLFNSILGQIKPDEGSIALNGKDVTHAGPLGSTAGAWAAPSRRCRCLAR